MLKADLVVEGFLDKQIFPKSPVTEAGSFAIFVLYVGKIISGSVDDRVKNKWLLLTLLICQNMKKQHR